MRGRYDVSVDDVERLDWPEVQTSDNSGRRQTP